MNLYGNLDAAGRCQMAPLQKNQHPEDLHKTTCGKHLDLVDHIK